MTGMVDEIDEQPETLHRLLDTTPLALTALGEWSAKLAGGKFRRVVFTGMGGSFYATYPALIYLIAHGIDALTIESSELLHHYAALLNPQSLLIAVSQSGRSVEVAKVLAANEANGDRRASVIGITNDPASPLALNSDFAMLIHAGHELTVSSKTYTCTLAALHLLVRGLLGESLDASIVALRAAADGIAQGLPLWKGQVMSIVERIQPCNYALFVGRGQSRASALTGAVIVKETAKLPTDGMVGGQYRHGTLEVVGPGVTTVIFAGLGEARNLNLKLVEYLESLTGQTVVIGATEMANSKAFGIELPVKSPDEWTLPIVEIVPVQLCAARLAALRGFEVGHFRYGQKVTVTE